MSRRRWIEHLNPLRNLTPATVVGYLEAGQRGELAMLMWLYHIIEQSDPDLLALVERRASAIGEMDWNIGQAADDENGRRNTEERAEVRNRWVTINGRRVLVGEEGDMKNPHSASQQAAEIGKGLKAMRDVLAGKTDRVAAVARGDIGAISFYWGEPESNGISHILAKHGEAVALIVPEAVVRGNLGPVYQNGQKRNIEYGPYTVALKLVKDDEHENWVVTALDRRKPR
jgi:hypothetical protein